MPASCAAFGCTNYFYKKESQNRKVSYHKFPMHDRELLEQWVVKVRRLNFVPNNTSKLCSDHFEQDCFTIERNTGRRIIKADAVPTKFSFVARGNSKRKMFSSHPEREYTKECFETLKKQIPGMDEGETLDEDILRNALSYIQALKTDECDAEHEMERLAFEKIALQQRLSTLKADLAPHFDHIDDNIVNNGPVVIYEDNNKATTSASGEKDHDYTTTYVKLSVARQDGDLQNNSSQKQPRARNSSRSSILHNKIEKNRRARLTEGFKALKKQIPTMDKKERSYTAILRNAHLYIQALKKTEHDAENEIERLACEKIALQQRLFTLKRELASHLDHIDNNDILNNDPVVILEDDNEETTTASECGSDYDDDDHPDISVLSSVASVELANSPSSSPANTVFGGPLTTNASILAYEDDYPNPTNNSTAENKESIQDDLIALNFLKEHCHILEKIPPRWAISAFEDYIVCARWNSECNIDRKIIIKNDLSVNVYIENNEELDFVACEKVNSLKALSRLIYRIEELPVVQDYSNMGIHMNDSVNSEKEEIRKKTQHQSEENGSHANVDEEVSTSTDANVLGNCETVVSHITENHFPICEITPVQTSIPLQIFPNSVLESASNQNKVIFVKSNVHRVNHTLNFLQEKKCSLITREQSTQTHSKSSLANPFTFFSATNSTSANDSNVPISFNFLKENLHDIRKQMPLWTISALENFIVCARWDSYGEIDRKIIINDDLSFKVYLENKETELGSDLKVESLETFSKLILMTDHITICPKIHINEGKCDGFLQEKWYCRKRNLCLGCIKWEEKNFKQEKKRQRDEQKFIELMNLLT